MRRLLLLVSAIVLLDTLFYSVLAPLLPSLTERLELTKGGAGVLVAANALGTSAGAIPAGLASVRVGTRATTLTGLVVLTTMTAAFGFADSLWALQATRFAQGVGSAFAWTGALGWLIAAAPRERRAELIGIVLGVSVGGTLLGPLVGAVASVSGRAPTFSAVAVLGLLLFLWAVAEQPPVGERQLPPQALLAAARDSAVRVGVWLVALPALFFGLLGVLAPLALDRAGWGAVAIGALFMVGAGMSSLVSPLVGRATDHYGSLRLTRIGLPAGAATAIMLPWPRQGWLLAVALIASWLSFELFWVPGMALMSEGAEAAHLHPALAFSLMNLVWAPAYVLGSAGGGALANTTGDVAPFALIAALCLLTLAGLPPRDADSQVQHRLDPL